jgi:regulator of protease activity HflC (stomatin/prohibitin superfamily)
MDFKMTEQYEVEPMNGFTVILFLLIFIVCASFLVVGMMGAGMELLAIIAGTVAGFVALFILRGFFILEPNQAQVLLLFGAYKGTVTRSGFHWVFPLKLPSAILHPRFRMSLRSRNFNGEILKVNDKQGNPIEIAAVIVWKVKNTAQAVFDVEDFIQYVEIQSEAAVRHLANSYPYDHGEGQEVTLRCDIEEVSIALQKELQDRVMRAGVLIEEARISHLAYAPEIAGAMLRRQQAEAIISARKMIVQGAVSMVEMALGELKERDVVNFDEKTRASMISNLLVVLCSEKDPNPVLNTGMKS